MTSPPDIIPQMLNIDYSGRRAQFLFNHTTLEESRQQNRTIAPLGHSHNLFHIVLFLGDDNYFSLGEKAVACKTGTLVITSPGQSHDFGPLRPGNLRYHEVTFSLLDCKDRELDLSIGTYLATLFGLAKMFEIPTISECTTERIKVIQALYQKVCQSLIESGGSDLSVCYRNMFRLLEYVSEMFFNQTLDTLDKKSELEKAKEYIAGNYSRNLSLDEMAGKANLSKYHFCRAFRKEFAISPKAYQIELRLQSAAQLLQTSGLNCGEISDKLGFSDQYFFSKIFKKRFGISPRNYARIGLQ